jgi:predicted nucleic acid-binding protein
MKFIVLDSTPLGLLTQPPQSAPGLASRAWLAKASVGAKVIIPEIVDYEVRRELIRAGKSASVQRLDQLLIDPLVITLPIRTSAMRLAADLWAKARQQGKPTADVHALDVDVILAAQVLDAGYSPTDFIVATSFVPSAPWSSI